MKNSIINKQRIKIFLIILVTFIAVNKFTDTVFLANTPRISPVFITSIYNLPSTVIEMPGKTLASIGNLFKKKNNNSNNNGSQIAKTTIITPAPNIFFQTISTGVSAAEDPQTGQTLIQIQAGAKYKIVGTVTIDGKEYPKIEFVP